MSLQNSPPDQPGWVDISLIASLIVNGAVAIWFFFIKSVFPWLTKRQEARDDDERQRERLRQDHALRRQEDDAEFGQEMEREGTRIRKLRELAAIGSSTWKDEQLTSIVADDREDRRAAEEFIRNEVAKKMDIAIQLLDDIKRLMGYDAKITASLHSVIKPETNNDNPNH